MSNMWVSRITFKTIGHCDSFESQWIILKYVDDKHNVHA